MTTTVTVETFNDEAVVERVNPETHRPQGPKEEIPKGEKRTFHVHQHLALIVSEKDQS